MAQCRKCGGEFKPALNQIKRNDLRCLACERKRDRLRRRGEGRKKGEFRDLRVPVPEAGCWLWTGSWTSDGYARVSLGKRGQGMAAHRYFFEQAYGPIPRGMCVCHKCDTPVCCNPEHLFLGTNADNMADRKAKGRYRGVSAANRLRTAQQARA